MILIRIVGKWDDQMKNKKNKVSKNQKIISIFLSLFLSYITIYKFLFLDSEFGRNLGFFYYVLLVFLFYYLVNHLIKFYFKIINFFILKFNKTNLKNFNEYRKITLLPTSIVLGISSLILLVISIYYVGLYWQKDNPLNEYGLVGLDLNTNSLPILIIVAIFIFIVLQIYTFYKIEGIRKINSFFISLISTTIISVIIYFLIKIMYGLLWVIALTIGFATGPAMG